MIGILDETDFDGSMAHIDVASSRSGITGAASLVAAPGDPR